MLKSSIDFYSGPTIEERVFHFAKHICAGFAVVAVTISTLDLMNIRPVEAAAEMMSEHRITPKAIPGALIEGVRSFSLSTQEKTEIAVLIPRDIGINSSARILASPSLPPSLPVANASAPRGASPVAGLAEARHEDAIELAMASPAGVKLPAQPAGKAQAQLDSHEPALPQAQPTLQLASLTPTSLPVEATPAVLSAPVVALPAVLSFLPPPAPGVPPPSPIQRLHLEGKSLARAERCLANAVYFEARDQPFRGQVAVAQVVLNRVFSEYYPNDVCQVVYQNADRHLACQFTFACDGKSKRINERGAWARANRIARETLEGKLYEPAVGTATHYHALYVHPNWVREMHKLVRYGIHSFYRPIAWGNGSDEPVWSKLALKKKDKH